MTFGPFPNDNDNVIPLKGPRPVPPRPDPTAPDPKIVELLQNMMKEVERGGVSFMAVAYVKDGVAITAWDPHQSTPAINSTAMGAIGFLSARFAAALIDGEEQTTL